MEKKTCLIIDDTDQSDIRERIRANGLKLNIDIECREFNVGSQWRTDLLNDGNIDIEKVIQIFKEEFNGVKFDLIAFDYDLEDKEQDLERKVTGLTLISRIGEIRKRSIKLIYSAMLNDLLQDIFEEYKKTQNLRTAKSRIKSLLFNGIRDFADRSDYDSKIITLLQAKEPNIDDLIEEKMREYNSMTFLSIYPAFKGMTFGNIADIMESDIIRGNKFKREIIDQIISNMVEINEK